MATVSAEAIGRRVIVCAALPRPRGASSPWGEKAEAGESCVVAPAGGLGWASWPGSLSGAGVTSGRVGSSGVICASSFSWTFIVLVRPGSEIRLACAGAGILT